jgi:hypothetical protein
MNAKGAGKIWFPNSPGALIAEAVAELITNVLNDLKHYN